MTRLCSVKACHKLTNIYVIYSQFVPILVLVLLYIIQFMRAFQKWSTGWQKSFIHNVEKWPNILKNLAVWALEVSWKVKEHFKSPIHQSANKHSNKNNGHKVRSININTICMNTLSKTLRWLHNVRCILGCLINITVFWFSFWLMLSWCAEFLNLPPETKTFDRQSPFNKYITYPNFYRKILSPAPSPFFNWDSFHARLNSHYKAWSYKKKKHKKLKQTENLFGKNLKMSNNSRITVI